MSQHGTVNHSIEFVNPATRGSHTTRGILLEQGEDQVQEDERCGVQDTMLSSYLDEYMWRERHGPSGSTVMNSLFRDIARRYPV